MGFREGYEDCYDGEVHEVFCLGLILLYNYPSHLTYIHTYMHIFHFKCSNKTLLETFDSPRVYGIQNDADEIISRVALRHIKFCKIKQQVYCADFHMNIFDFSFKLFTFPSILIPECEGSTNIYTFCCV